MCAAMLNGYTRIGPKLMNRYRASSHQTQENTPADHVILMKIVGTEYSFHTSTNKHKTKTMVQENTYTYSICLLVWGLEKLELKTAINHTPNSTHGKGQAKCNT